MRFGWIGFHADGVPALEALLCRGTAVHLLMTLGSSRTGAPGPDQYRRLAERFRIPIEMVPNVNHPQAQRLIERADLDVVFVIGWPQRVHVETIHLARVGMIGSHASLLPHNPGPAPINWSLIRGEHETGSTLLWLGPNDAPLSIVDQVAIPITPFDTAGTLYQRAGLVTRDMLIRLVPRLEAGERPSRRAASVPDEHRQRRRASRGRISWQWPSTAVYNFVRALSRPFPGAFAQFRGRRWTVWHAGLIPGTAELAPPGTVLGPVVSPIERACGQLVACGTGAVVLLELESRGMTLTGQTLSQELWTGERWSDE